MSRPAYVDVVGGAAGDMLVAALLDAGADPEPVREAVETVLPGRFEIGTEEVRRGGLRARWLRIAERAPGTGHSRPSDMLDRVERAALPDGVSRRASAVLDRLFAAESRVHGTALDRLEGHDLGDDDTLLDVVAVAAALESLDVDVLGVSAVPLESDGWLPGSAGHPPVPLPAPVTLELLRGFAIRPGGAGEVVTPTAAAVFAALGTPMGSVPEMVVESVGYGAGTRDPVDRPNVVRVLVGRPGSGADVGASERELSLLEANLDDLSPELVSDAARALLEAGALDAWTTATTMKKGRSGVILSALCEPEREPALRHVFFLTTSTFGVRAHRVRRAELERRVATVEVGDASVRVKVGLLGGRVCSATPEHDDVADAARRAGRPVREVYEDAAAAARALRYADAPGQT